MAVWLSELPSPTRRTRSMSTPELYFDEQGTKVQSKLSVQTGLKDLSAVAPRHEHENSLRQHPIRRMHLPIRLRVPQRRSSLSFRPRSSHNSSRIYIMPNTQVGSPEADSITHFQLGLPKQTTTTGLHLNYGQTRTIRPRQDLSQQTTKTGLHLNYPQHAITRPQPVALAPRDATSLAPVSHLPHTTEELRVECRALNDQILAHFDPQVRNTDPRSTSNMQNQDDRAMARDTVVVDFQRQFQASEPAPSAPMLNQQASQMTQVRQLFGRDTTKEGRSRKRSRSEVSGSQWPRMRDQMERALTTFVYNPQSR